MTASTNTATSYTVTFRYYLPIRSDKDITVNSDTEENAIIEARSVLVRTKGVGFGTADYIEKPFKVVKG